MSRMDIFYEPSTQSKLNALIAGYDEYHPVREMVRGGRIEWIREDLLPECHRTIAFKDSRGIFVMNDSYRDHVLGTTLPEFEFD